MKTQFPNFGDAYDAGKMRQFVLLLQQAFDRVLLFSGPSYSALAAATIPRTTTATTVTITGDDWLVLVDTTAGNVAVSLPSAALVKGRSFTVKRTTGGANTLVVTPVAGNIDGAASQAMVAQYLSYTFYSDGSNYFII